MDSSKNMDFEKAIEYMDPLQVTDYLQKTLDFLQRNNNEIYFPSISPYVEAFLVNLVSDTRNLKSKSFKYEDKKLASDIIEFLEISRDVFQWTHGYERGNMLVYKKIFTNKIKKKPGKPSTIAHRLHQAQHQQSTPDPTHAPDNASTIDNREPDLDFPVTTTRFKLRFLSKTLRFIKNGAESTLVYDEMPHDQAEYIYHLIKYQDKDVGFGYKSLYAPLWEAMEEYGVDYKFGVKLEKISSKEAVVTLEKIPNKKKSKTDKALKREDIHNSIEDTDSTEKGELSRNTRSKRKQESRKQNQSVEQPIATAPALPPLELLSNINERFFTDSVVALIEFADDEARASVVFHQLSEEELTFVRRVKTLAESPKVREMFAPQHRDLLCRLDCSIKQVMKTCKITKTVNEREKSITLKKTPRFATPLPVTKKSATSAARSKSLAAMITRDRSISKDRIIQFQKGGKLPTIGNIEPNNDNVAAKESQEDRGRSKDGMNKRTAKLLEDLSTPVESDKGMRMMLLMGWDGGALGARGDGIMEPVMPAIDLPVRGGLGHVPPPKPPKPPKVVPRRPLDFRLTFLHAVYDLLLHEDCRKEIQFKDPLVKREKRFIQAALGTLNKRRPLQLTEQESELVRLVAGELAGKPGLGVEAYLSDDLKFVTLHKLTDQPMKAPKPPKPKPVKTLGVITITDDHADVVITDADVVSVIPHVEGSERRVAGDLKAIRKRAARLVFLIKLAEVLNDDCHSKIVFRFDFTLSKKLKAFIQDIVDGLNKGRWHSGLLGWEADVFADLRHMTQGCVLTAELAGQKFIFTKTPLDAEMTHVHPEPNLWYNNNDDKTDNRNPVIDVDDCIEQTNVDNDNSKEEFISVGDNVDNQSLVQDVENPTNNLEENLNLDLNEITLTNEHNETNDSKCTLTPDDNSPKNRTGYIRVKDVSVINAEVERFWMENEKIEDLVVRMETQCDIEETNVEESDSEIKSEVNNNGVTESEADILNIPEISELEKDIQELEATLMNERSNSVLNEEDNGCDLEIGITESDLDINTKKEVDIDYLNAKRSHSSSVCSQELDPKKVKISTETDELIVILIPKNQSNKIEVAKQVQTAMADEIDKPGGFLPLLKCHGLQNGGLMYSCHDEDDVAWLKTVISAANLEVNIVADTNSVLGRKDRELLIMINSYIPLSAKAIFRKIEIYNVGLDTNNWKVLYKHTDTTFTMFKVTVDEDSFKFISQENFSLYCGIDKAQFSII